MPLNMSQKISRIFQLIFIVIFSVVLTGCTVGKRAEDVSVSEQVKASPDFSNDVVPVIEVPAEPAEVAPIIVVSEEDGINAFDLLQQNAEINYKMYDFGLMVNDINGIASSDEYFWALYVNGAKSQKGADQTFLKIGDEMEWRYEEIVF